MFEKPSYANLFRAWFADFPSRNRQVDFHPEDGATTKVGGASRSLWAHGLPGDPLQRRIDVIAENVAELRDDVNQLKHDISQLESRQGAALSTEATRRLEEHAALYGKLETAQTGGLHISLIGLIWLSVGVLFTSVPSEIAALR